MNDKREEAEAPSGNLQRLAAALDAVDRELAELNAAQASGNSGETARIKETRDLLRRAIQSLAPETPSLGAPAEATEETGSGKRRVKIKAESEIATSSEVVSAAGTPSKSDDSTAKPAARVARAGRRVAAAEKAARGSLIARLGAAAEAAVPERPPVHSNEGGPTAVVPAGRAGTDKAISGTAERLAQLEAEIADLTERVTATPAADHASAEKAWDLPVSPASARPNPADTFGDMDDDDDDDDAEITIIGADGAPVEATTQAGRQAPRIFREGAPPLDEEEAEVEIRGSGVAAAGGRGADRPGTVRVSASTTAGAGGRDPRGKWRLFGGSS